ERARGREGLMHGIDAMGRLCRSKRPQRLGELTDGGKALITLACEAFADHGVERLRQIRAELTGWLRIDVDDLREELADRVLRGLAGPARREELVEDDAERPDITPCIDLFRRADLLRRHVLRRAQQTVRGRQRCA